MLRLRAFRIENPCFTESHSGILGLLQQVLTEESTAAQRRMTLNAESPDRELLANFTWAKNNVYLFGLMLRVIPADTGGVMDERLFSQRIITMADINEGNSSQSQYKDHFYFAINNNFLVTNLAGNINIDRLQTYINWLLEGARGERLFRFTELAKLPDGVPLSDIKDIQLVGGGMASAAPAERKQTTLVAKLGSITNDLLGQVFGSDTDSLEKIRASQLVEAKLVLKIKRRNRGLSVEEYKRVMSAVATNVTNDSGIVVRTKTGNKFTGESVKVKKAVSIQCIGPNRLVEEQLKQQMEQFLGELREQKKDTVK